MGTLAPKVQGFEFMHLNGLRQSGSKSQNWPDLGHSDQEAGPCQGGCLGLGKKQGIHPEDTAKKGILGQKLAREKQSTVLRSVWFSSCLEGLGR